MIDPDDTITQAAQKMKSSDAGVLPVVRGDEVVGTITDRDIVLRVVAEKLDPQAARVEQVMSREPVYCSEDDDVQVAAKMMERVCELVHAGAS
jgi:CBS domain-containing protein